MNSISQTLTRIKANVENALPETTVRALVAGLARCHHNRTLTPVVTTYLFLQQVLHGNAAVMHQDLHAGDVLLGDRAFCSYAHLALCVQRGLHGLFRAHQKLIISFRPRRRHAGPGKIRPAEAGLPRSRWLQKLGKDDQVVEYFKPPKRPDWMTAAQYAALPPALVVRELRFRVRLRG